MIKLSNKNVIVGGKNNKLYFFDLDTLKINKEVDVNNEKYVKVVEDINTFISVLNI